ncbi:protein FAR1-RELATED SEQUENCE 5-like [Rhododendron vialii]|uniref:protein FAR1-RELATED SEQUENCE 5-like n=1 Tax=Rhododendron vialii TaxID=182163 RepID=UPI00265F585B|nr:protein FAR1-RELATED SEQUENCE 5-like [Rhododendron vialii]XP_058216126.1 protein FAR1-RELATED SEQUENCE 5-like [Rhododendron vialii]
MSEEEQIGVVDDSVEQSSVQASDGEALISSLLKTRTMMTEEKEINVAIEIKPVEQSCLHLPDLMKDFEFADFVNLGSSNDKKAHGIDEGDNGSVDKVEVIVPQCGMIFDTADEAYNFYNRYARKIGFSVRKQRTNKSKADQNKILRQVLVCSCEGTYKKIRTPRKRRENQQFDCKALLKFKLIGDKYHVIQFMSDHTHDLVPPQFAHYLRSQRRIEFSQVGLINKMHSSGFKQSDIYSYMSTKARGPQYLNFIPSDCYNLIQKKRAGFFKRGDSQCLLEYLKQKTQENKHFFYSFRTTDENEARGVFFCDAKSRRDYGLFGDAICFDTTFRTNNYDMLCAPIGGINNHGQTTLFGCGLLDGETTDAVTWLFTTFLEAMGGKKPISIFTDQSRAIANAIRAMFPDFHHGLCIWHIYQHAAKHLSQVFAGFKSFTSRFKACIYDGETIEEF